ncbi:FxsA family protein [Shimia sp.]|uniref:FxsA family protein n=1 Tax=Shimia sp. TaxID=1954381 RepID=UPI0035682F98
MWLFLAFVGVPLIEIALFIQVGGAIGLWPTLGVVVVTAIAGTYLVRSQGLRALGNLQRSFAELDNPAEPLAHGAMILFAGALLLTPGFFTDALGFALLVPAVRVAVFRFLRTRVQVQSFAMGAMRGEAGTGPRPAAGQGEVIDGEFSELDPAKRPTHRPSEWTKH